MPNDETKRADDFARFLANISVGEPAACWPWLGATVIGCGYGRFSLDELSVRAHRHIYILIHGPIANNLVVRHKCDNPVCVNPRHLTLGTPKQNTADKYERGRAADRRGTKHPLARLSEAQVQAIRRAVSLGQKHHAVAQAYGISRQHVGRITRGEGWRHV